MPRHPLASRTFRGTARKTGETPEPSGSPRTAAIRLLSRRDYSTHELQERLTDRGFEATAVDQALKDLHKNGLLDDARVAAAHVRTAVAVKGRGRWRVARELEARGISRETAEHAMSALDADAEAVALKKILARKRFPSRPTDAERRRIVQHLLRRGFPADAIYRAVGRGGVRNDPESD